MVGTDVNWICFLNSKYIRWLGLYASLHLRYLKNLGFCLGKLSVLLDPLHFSQVRGKRDFLTPGVPEYNLLHYGSSIEGDSTKDFIKPV